jgi:hypothetical protein
VNFISIGEVLWDIVGQEEHLGGATLIFQLTSADWDTGFHSSAQLARTNWARKSSTACLGWA